MLDRRRFAMFMMAAGAAQAGESDVQALGRLIQSYTESIDRADPKLAEDLFSSAPEVSFIHPRGEETGLAAIQSKIYAMFRDIFTERKLTAKDIRIHVNGKSAWAQFNWEFTAKMKQTGAPYRSQGRETQIYRREKGRWRIVHVHYSARPASGN